MPQSQREASANRSGTVAIVGRPNVGKSTLLNAALQERLAIVTPTPQTTRDRILGVVRRGNAQIALIDTPGLHRPHSRLGRRMNAAARDAAREADAVVFMTDVPAKAEGELRPHPQDLKLIEQLKDLQHTVLVINKVDRLKDKSLLLPLMATLSQAHPFAAVVPISARREDGVVRVLDEVAKLLPERGPMYDEDFLTDRPLRFFAAEYVREQVMLATRQEVPHQVAVEIERFDDAGKVVHIHASIHVGREGHKGIIIGAKGERLRTIGTAARTHIEALLERQVNLQLRVHVEQDWVDSPKMLDAYGYGTETAGPGDEEVFQDE